LRIRRDRMAAALHRGRRQRRARRSDAALPEDAKRALRYMALMDQMRNGEVMLLMPFDIRIK